MRACPEIQGWWRARNGQKCEPFTVRDAHSRFVLAATLLPGARGALVRGVLEQLFHEHGTPRAIQCDNGSPFVCTRARGGLTQLSAWLVSLGIRLIRSRPGKPQDNGGHERMHRDLAELELAPARSRRAQQRGSAARYEAAPPHPSPGVRRLPRPARWLRLARFPSWATVGGRNCGARAQRALEERVGRVPRSSER